MFAQLCARRKCL